ncbi:dephospho-CoA kinase [Cognatishimia sp.]|uniref:dephospho-CoA kinase n=1 Tax=Cognatishimia sp. TaxID=2211648 RepID=UPI0035163D66
MTFKLGLTGSIGMGKSSTARIFADLGCAVWDADAAVHRLYTQGGPAVAPIAALFPEAVVDGSVSRDALKTLISANSQVLGQIEAIVHPLVAQDRADFIANSNSDVTVLDIPLLFETGSEATMDAIVCVSVPPEVQEARVLARGTMSRDTFETIKRKQMPNDDKCKRSDYVVITDTPEHATSQVAAILQTIREGLKHA